MRLSPFEVPGSYCVSLIDVLLLLAPSLLAGAMLSFPHGATGPPLPRFLLLPIHPFTLVFHLAFVHPSPLPAARPPAAVIWSFALSNA
jgi:hypothetical protein